MENNRINIAIAVNDSFVMPALVMLNSLFTHTKSEIKVLLLYCSLSAANRNKIKAKAEQYNQSFEELKIGEDMFRGASLNSNPMYSIEIYYRILLPYITKLDKILWLDADIIIKDDIKKLYDTDVSDAYVAACKDIGDYQGGRDEIKSVMKMTERTYFNSGVLLMNTAKIRAEIAEKSFFDCIDKYSEALRCPDQDVLNKVLGEKLVLLDSKYNFLFHGDREKAKDISNVVVVHYIWKKPWNKDYEGFLEGLFLNEAWKCGYKGKCIKLKVYFKLRSVFRIMKEYFDWIKRKIAH